MIEGRLAELSSATTEQLNVGNPPTQKVDRSQALLLSIFPEPEESRRIEALFAHGTNLSGETLCHYIREAFSR
jgi:hypothetical protein